jgi:nucleotide-binding universal stress UspA family protein
MERILVGIDDSLGARAALRWAIAQAKTTGARIDAVHVYPFDLSWIDQTSDHVPQWRARALKHAQEDLDRVVDSVVGQSSTVEIQRLVLEGSPAAVLIEAAKQADLLAVGTRGRSEFVGLLLGSVSQRCAERAPCPVVVVPPHPVDLRSADTA